MNNLHALTLVIGNIAVIAFMVPLLAFIVVYIPILWRRQTVMGWSILGSRIAMFLLGGAILIRNWIQDFPGLPLLRLILFVIVVAYYIWDFIVLLKAKASARRVSPVMVPPQVPIVEPKTTDDESD